MGEAGLRRLEAIIIIKNNYISWQVNEKRHQGAGNIGLKFRTDHWTEDTDFFQSSGQLKNTFT